MNQLPQKWPVLYRWRMYLELIAVLGGIAIRYWLGEHVFFRSMGTSLVAAGTAWLVLGRLQYHQWKKLWSTAEVETIRLYIRQTRQWYQLSLLIAILILLGGVLWGSTSGKALSGVGIAIVLLIGLELILLLSLQWWMEVDQADQDY